MHFPYVSSVLFCLLTLKSEKQLKFSPFHHCNVLGWTEKGGNFTSL